MPEEEIAPIKKSEFEPDLEAQSSDPLSQSEQGSFIDLPSRFRPLRTACRIYCHIRSCAGDCSRSLERL